MKPAVNGYDLSRAWFDFAFENNDKVDCKHTAMYFYCIDLNNRLGWKEKFGLPTDQTMNALSIRNHRTYSKIFQDIVDWGFINVIKKSVNQHSSTIIALCKNTKASTMASTNAHTKAIQRQVQMQEQKQQQGTATIDKQENIKTLNNKTSIINNTLAEQSSAYKNLEKSKENIFEFIKTEKPQLIEPYADYWNLFADKYSLAKVTKITDSRKKKFKTRLAEEKFNFLKITKKLTEASDFVLTQKWMTFDWVIFSESNYVKILEGNYDKTAISNEKAKNIDKNPEPEYTNLDGR